MAWYNTEGNEKDIVISSRVRFARNLTDHPFASRMTAGDAKTVIDAVRAAADGAGYTYTDLEAADAVSARALVEEHFISPEFAEKKGPHGLLVRDDLSVMLCEEDHIRLQCILPGLALEEAYREAAAADDALLTSLPVAFDEKFGYLTQCPTNIGTGMRASVMLFLPALTLTGQIKRLAAQLPKLGQTVRGLYGEGSVADGCLYQISNQITIGTSEEDIIRHLTETVNKIMQYERDSRRALFGEDDPDRHDELVDTVYRALGTLNSAYRLSSAELMKLYAYVRLGIAEGLVQGIPYAVLDDLLITSMPAMTAKRVGGEADSRTRDKARAAAIQKTLAKSREAGR